MNTAVKLPPGIVRAALRIEQNRFGPRADCTRCGDHGIIEFAEVWDGESPAGWEEANPLYATVHLANGADAILAGYQSVAFCRCKKTADANALRRRVEEEGQSELTERGKEQTWATWRNEKTEITQMRPGPEHTVMVSGLIGWVPASGDVMVSGPKRVGKTHVGNAMAHVMLTKGIASLVVNLTDLLARERRQDNAHPIDDAIASPVLFVDDLGTSRLTAWELETIYRLVDRRIEEKRATWWFTNLEPEDLIRYFRVPNDPIASENGARILMRLTESCKWVYRFARAGQS